MISWFATATYNVDFAGNCPENRNGGRTEITLRELRDIGFTTERAEELIRTSANSTGLPDDISRRMANRANVNGQAMSIYNYPEAVRDPNLEMVTGKFAYGF